MDFLSGSKLISCYIDMVAFFIMVLLMILPGRVRRNRYSMSIRYFSLLCPLIAFSCVVCFIFHAMEGYTSDLSHIVAVTSRFIWELSAITVNLLWIAYVDQKLNGKNKFFTTSHIILFCIVFITLIILITNLFTGFMYTIGSNNIIKRAPFNYVIYVCNFALFLWSTMLVLRFDSKSNKTRFLRVSPMIVSIFLSIIPQFFTPYGTVILGYAVGATLLYLSIVSERRFLDPESGFYNARYLSYLMDMASSGKNDTRSVLILHSEGDLPSVFDILQDVLNRNGDVIRAGENKFLMFSNSDSRSTIQYLSSMVDESLEKHNNKCPDKKIQITARCHMRNKNESAFEFLRTAIDKNDSGDEMVGIVTMISELDRLDKELSMAAEIQRNAVPTNFPPFPEHKEFELYASMTPAKEVGGDFYDFFLIDNDHLALIISDVSGKGIPAALFMMISKSFLKNTLTSGFSPSETLKKANLQLYEHNTSMMFISVWLAVIELSTGKGIACNAGHENPALYRAGQAFEMLKYKHDSIIGVMPDRQYNQRDFQLKPGDCIFVYTDGITEARNQGYEMFTEQRLLTELNKKADAAPKELICHVHEAVNEFVGDAPQYDDITMLCFKYYGPQ